MRADQVRCCVSLSPALLAAVQPARSTADWEEPCPKPKAETVARRFDRWGAVLGAGNPDPVFRLYAGDAVLLPALSDWPLVGRDQIRMHFAQFLRSRRAPFAATAQRRWIYRVTGRCNGAHVLIGDRYAIPYECRDGDWRIVNHRISSAYQPLSNAADRGTKGNDSLGYLAAPQ
jgi:hypothetical protein